MFRLDLKYSLKQVEHGIVCVLFTRRVPEDSELWVLVPDTTLMPQA